MKNWSKRSISVFLISLFVCTSVFSGETYHMPNVSIGMKLGNVRDIGRLGILVPLFDSQYNMTYFHAFGMADSKSNKEGNYALGYRQLVNGQIIGGYAYYDRRYEHNQLIHQITPGIELLGEKLEYRLNGYLPISKTKNLGTEDVGLSVDKPTSSIYLNQRHHNLVPMKGFDAEVGYNSLNSPVNVYLAYYHFTGDKVKSIYGPRVRTAIKLHNNFSLTGEIQYDSVRKTSYFAGFNLNILFGKKLKSHHWSYTKMSQLPERDIDVVTGVSYTDDKALKEKRDTIVEVNSYDEFNKKVVAEGSDKKIFVITKDIHADKNSSHIPIGDNKTPFQGILFGGEKSTKDNTDYDLKMRDIYLSKIDTSKLYIGLFGIIENADISHIGIMHKKLDIKSDNGIFFGGLAGKSINSRVDKIFWGSRVTINSKGISHAGAIIGNADKSTITNCYSSRGKIHAKSPGNYGGIVGSLGSGNSVTKSYSRGVIFVESEGVNAGGAVGYADSKNEILGNTVSPSANLEVITPNKNDKFRFTDISLGGIAGYIESGNTVNNNIQTGTVHGEKSKSGNTAGIVGYAGIKNIINENENYGEVYGAAQGCTAGIVAYADKGNTISINNNYDDIFGEEVGDKIGGITGLLNTGNTVSHNLSTGDVVNRFGKDPKNKSKILENNMGSVVGTAIGEKNIINYNLVSGSFTIDNASVKFIGKGNLYNKNNIVKHNMGIDSINSSKLITNFQELSKNKALVAEIIKASLDTCKRTVISKLLIKYPKILESVANKNNMLSRINRLLDKDKKTMYYEARKIGYGGISINNASYILSSIFASNKQKQDLVLLDENKEELEEYFNAVWGFSEDTGKPYKGNFMIADAHWIIGQIDIDAKGNAALVYIDPLKDEGFCLDVVGKFHEIFDVDKDVTIYKAEGSRQYSDLGCSIFAFDDIIRLDNEARFLPNEYKNKGLISYMKDNPIKTYDGEFKDDVNFTESRLPLSFMASKQSSKLFNRINDASLEENNMAIGSKNQNIKQLTNKYFGRNKNGKGINRYINHRVRDMRKEAINYILNNDVSTINKNISKFSFDSFEKRLNI